MTCRYTIGVDLGTSNCALAYVDTRDTDDRVRVLSLPQLEEAGTVSSLPILPASIYYPVEGEREKLPEGAVFLLGETGRPVVVGRYALHQSGRLPGRVIRSAKSWLCHPGVDRRGPILPWHSEEIPASNRMSPVEAAAHYLALLRTLWDQQLAAADPDLAFARQEVTVTVPASFDEVAQQLTYEAARLAGFPARIRLLEEPQAAFYHWLDRNGQGRALLEVLPGLREKEQTVLICDIGGGTSDFSLFAIDPLRDEDRIPSIRRVEVSDHLLLGGDNMDLALAHRLEEMMAGGPAKLSASRWAYLVAEARRLKERALQPDSQKERDEFHVSVPGSGASLFAGTLSARISVDEIRNVVMDGFFPSCAGDERPESGRSGLKELGLPFPADPAITRHIAAFLRGRPIDAVLYAGGALKPDFLQQRLTDTLAAWQPGRSLTTLANEEPDLAVARGAASYGKVLREPFGRITGGYPHSLYLEIQSRGSRGKPKLVCILPKGFEENRTVRIENMNLKLLVGQPVRFQPYYSTLRDEDEAGALVDLDEETFHPLPALQTGIALQKGMTKPADGRLPVMLETTLNELGTLRIACVHRDSDRNEFRWDLDFNLRRPAEREETGGEPGQPAEGPDEERVRKAEVELSRVYGKKNRTDPEAKPRKLVRQLETVVGQKREEWDLALLRSLWPPLQKGMTRKNRSPDHESTWLNLAGYLLRPGYGNELDSFRIEELWRLRELGMAFPKEKRVVNQWWILWRRVAGGLDRPRQEEIVRAVLPAFRNKNVNTTEVFRLAGSLERVPQETKEELVDRILQIILEKRAPPADPIWALGRLLSRVPLYAGPDGVLPPAAVKRAFEQLKDLDWAEGSLSGLNEAFARAGRRVEVRENDIPETFREALIAKMANSGATERQLRVVREYVPVEHADQANLFGESLPAGLILT